MTSPGATSLKRASTARVAQGSAPTWTGMWSACAISRDCTSQIASEKSRLELRICEYDVRSMASPISATIELSRCWTTERVMGSTVADMCVCCTTLRSVLLCGFFRCGFLCGLDGLRLLRRLRHCALVGVGGIL